MIFLEIQKCLICKNFHTAIIFGVKNDLKIGILIYLSPVRAFLTLFQKLGEISQ